METPPDAEPQPEPIPEEAVEAEPLVPTDDVVVPIGEEEGAEGGGVD